MFTLHNTECRACRGDKLVPVMDLGIQPLSNDFCRDGQERQGYAPLTVLFCHACGLAQLSVIVRPDILYSNYLYTTSDSKTMQEHFSALVRDLIEEQPAGSLVEIGSNNGALLEYFSHHGFGNFVGIEPAKNLADDANKLGIPTLNYFFDSNVAAQAKGMCGKVDFVLARHCFCHCPNWHKFVEALEVLADKETVIGVEVPYLPEQIIAVSFDQIYFEHASYLSIKAMNALLRDSKLHVHRVIKYPIHGGSILILIRRNDSMNQPHPSAASYLAQEDITADTWREFSAEAHSQIHKLKLLVRSIRDSGKTVCGYGASAKSTVWISSCGFTKKDICFITDTTKNKWYTVSPGTNIPVTDPGALLRELPDYAIIFAWNYKDEILAKETLYRSKGGRFIVPVPSIKIC